MDGSLLRTIKRIIIFVAFEVLKFLDSQNVRRGYLNYIPNAFSIFSQ